MTSLKAMGLLLLAMFVMVAESSSSSRRGGGNSHNYDLSDKADQTRLYNSKVYEAEKVSRPLDGWLSWTGARHSGVRVTVEDGSQYLIHKGKDYGISSQTVVVDADHMSSKWRVDDTKDFGGDKTVSDFVGAGGPDYSLLKKNCHDATDDMWRTTLTLVLLAMSVMLSKSSTDGGKTYNYDLSKKSDLTKLYNSKVFKAERMTRPLKGLSFQLSKLSHSGVRVTLEDGTTWLVHKGDGYGISSQTVVVNARHMSNTWKIVETKNFGGSKTVSDFVKAGGTDYTLLFDNCHDASGRMMQD